MPPMPMAISTNVAAPTTVGTSQDMGTCCIANANYADAGYGTPTSAFSASKKLYNKFVCPARFTN